MTRPAIAMDLGTSGFRAQALDLASGAVLSTAITTRHPLPGANVIDHLHFALELGMEAARDLMIQAVNQVIGQLRIATGDVVRLAVCGNPAQLSLFQGQEIRDLAFAGARKLKALNVTPPERAAAIRSTGEFPGLALPASCEVIIPPAVRHEIGADALALILQSGMLGRDETAMAIDYGTSAEMALVHAGRVFTGSAAAGPALEGRHITCGTLAMPGAMADLQPDGDGHRLIVLDAAMQPVPGARIDLRKALDAAESAGPRAVKITGTGTIAALEQGLETGLIVLPRIRTADQRLHFGQGTFLTETDVAEAGKAIGAVRAGCFTLTVEAGITLESIHTAYLAGASGTYVDALKARRLGLVPPCVKTIRQIGNTSLAMARELALAPEKLDAMSALARQLRQTHCMFAASQTFTKVFLLELSYWTEGMPMAKYRELLRRHHLPDLPPVAGTLREPVPERGFHSASPGERVETPKRTEARAPARGSEAHPAAGDAVPQVIRRVRQDIDDLGRMGLVTLERVGLVVALPVEACAGCKACVEECPTGALSIQTDTKPPTIFLVHALCNGVACRRCEPACPLKVFHLNTFLGAATHPASEAEGAMLNK